MARATSRRIWAIPPDAFVCTMLDPMTDALTDRIAAAIGRDAVRRDPTGRVFATPTSIDAIAHLFGLAYDAQWRVALAGAATWQVDDTPADLVVSLRGLDDAPYVRPAEGMVRARAGVSLEDLRRTTFESGCWLALDPPGRADRTIGSVLATATAGPLRHGCGPVRLLVDDITIVTGDGRVMRSSDPETQRTVGGDLVKLHVGGFGGFGVIVAATLRLRPLPTADVSLVAVGDRDRLTSAAWNIANAGVNAVALELLSPALAAEADWTLAARLVGEHGAVAAECRRLTDVATGLTWQELPPERRGTLWSSAARATTTVPVTLRLGTVPDGIDDTLDLVVGRLGEGLISAGPVSGTIRWSGHAEAPTIRALRTELASREIPLTLERAPWQLRRAVGRFGAYREGLSGKVHQLRDAFDPHHVLVAVLAGEDQP